MGTYNVIFESENIHYIKMSELLINDYLKMYCDLEIQRLLFKKIFSREEIEKWINKLLSDKSADIFSMIEKGTAEYIGNIQLISKNNKVGEIMISITPEKQDRHYGTEAMGALVNYGKEILGLEELELYVKKTNQRAIHCYENIGFTINGDGLNEDDVHMTMSR